MVILYKIYIIEKLLYMFYIQENDEKGYTFYIYIYIKRFDSSLFLLLYIRVVICNALYLLIINLHVVTFCEVSPHYNIHKYYYTVMCIINKD